MPNQPNYLGPLPKLTVTVTSKTGGTLTVHLAANLTWTTTENVGDESLTCDITPAEYAANTAVYRYGSEVELTDSTGYSIWAGYLETPVAADDHVSLIAHGYGTLLDYAQPGGTDNNALLLQDMDLSVWQDANQSPWNIPHNDALGSHITPDGLMRWVHVAQQGEKANYDGMIGSYPGVDLGRFAFYTGAPSPGPGSPWSWRIFQVCSLAPDSHYWFRNAHDNNDQAYQPGGGVDVQQTYSVTRVPDKGSNGLDKWGQTHQAYFYQGPNGAYPARGQPYDTIAFLLYGQGDQSSGGVANTMHHRFNGLITLKDTYNASAALTYVGTAMGWNTDGIAASGINILPYYLGDGGPWSDAATYFSSSTVGTWGVSGTKKGKPAMYAIQYPADDTDPNCWIVSRADPATVDLQPSSDYFDIVKVRYSDWLQEANVVTVRVTGGQAKQDFANLGYDRMYDFSLSGAYPPKWFRLPNGNDVPARLTPNNVAAALLKSFSKPDVSGTINCLFALNQGAVAAAWRIRPGCAVKVKEDVGNPLQGLYKVRSVTGTEDGVSLGVGGVRPYVDQALSQAARDLMRGQNRWAE